ARRLSRTLILLFSTYRLGQTYILLLWPWRTTPGDLVMPVSSRSYVRPELCPPAISLLAGRPLRHSRRRPPRHPLKRVKTIVKCFCAWSIRVSLTHTPMPSNTDP